MSASSTSSSQWENLPRDILEVVFGNLLAGDRVRMSVVCKSWNSYLSEAKHIVPRILEAPWEILSEDSYDSYKPWVTQVCFKSLSEDRIYRIKIPDDDNHHHHHWLCGSSRGWLLMASGDRLDPALFLWDPLNGSTANLPPLSTHPNFEDLKSSIHADNVSCLFDRVQVFSQDSVECIVAVIFKNRGRQVAFCTPQDDTWIIYEKKEYNATYIDIVYHEEIGSLFLLACGNFRSNVARDLESRNRVDLPGGNCTVGLSFVILNLELRITDQQIDRLYAGVEGSHIFQTVKQKARLLKDTVNEDGHVLMLVTGLDRWVHLSNFDDVVQGTTWHYRTGEVFLTSMTGKVETTIGDRTIFLGSTSTNSIIVSGPVKGAEADCVYMAIDDCTACCSNNGDNKYVIREHNVYSVGTEIKMKASYCRTTRHPAPSKIGWFQPKFSL